MAVYIHQLSNWPHFQLDMDRLAPFLANLRFKQGLLLGRMEKLGFELREEASLQTLTLDVVKSSEIEGEVLNADQVRSSIAQRLGIDVAGLVPVDRHVDGVVEMMLDATQQYAQLLTAARLFGWHAALFPTGYSGMHRIMVGGWRDNPPHDPMQVVSGPSGRETIHFQAPASEVLDKEMNLFLDWFNGTAEQDPILKAAIAHLWFVTIHPFDDGNGRIARAITDMQLTRSDGCRQRFYSMSAQVRKERKAYYDVLEQTQKGDLEITGWVEWFLQCLERAIEGSSENLAVVMRKARFWEQFASVQLNERQRLMVNKLLDGFEGKLTSSKWAKITGTSADSAVRDINELLKKHILVKEEGGGRSTSYLLNEPRS